MARFKMPLLLIFCLLINLLMEVGLICQRASACESQSFDIGVGKSEIAGPGQPGSLGPVGMLGYADLAQVSAGLHMRLYSRAMVVHDHCGGRPIALVVNELGMVYYGLKKAILNSLDEHLPGVFNDHNLMFSATHTHAGPGGFSFYTLYNITTMGFSKQTFMAIRDGTVAAIIRAYKTQRTGSFEVGTILTEGLQFNRSPEAYLRNPEGERLLYQHDYDPEMVVLKAKDESGKIIAVFDWFGVHPVSLSMQNRLISGDNKGLAAYLTESWAKSSGIAGNDFIAAFVQSKAGDVSPYATSPVEAVKDAGYERNRQNAEGQFEAAKTLTLSEGSPIVGGVFGGQQFINISKFKVSPIYTGRKESVSLCRGGLGVSFAAGTENGKPFPLFHEGTIYGFNWPRITLMPAEQKCQGAKVLLLPTGYLGPTPWTATVVPFQIIRLGNLAIVGTPFEITTMAGRRIEKEVLTTLQPFGVSKVVISSLANEYLHYVDTKEEYEAQSYEGGSNLHGPNSLAGYTQIFHEVAHDIGQEKTPQSREFPPDLSDRPWGIPSTDFGDGSIDHRDVGAIEKDAVESALLGDEIRLQVVGARLERGTAGAKSFLQVQHREHQTWSVVYHDGDPHTFIEWQRVGIRGSRIILRWQTLVEDRPGDYRICYNGAAKQNHESIKPIRVCSRPTTLKERQR